LLTTVCRSSYKQTALALSALSALARALQQFLGAASTMLGVVKCMETEPQSHLNSGLKMTMETELEIEMMAGVIRSLFSILVSQQTQQTVKLSKLPTF
jgi:hypothetical protein